MSLSPHRAPFVQDRLRESRIFARVQITIHKLMLIIALVLLPLLAWHNATVHLFDKYDMPREWEEDFRKIQLAGSKTALWVALWISSSAIDSKRQCRKQLRPGAEEEQEGTASRTCTHEDTSTAVDTASGRIPTPTCIRERSPSECTARKGKMHGPVVGCWQRMHHILPRRVMPAPGRLGLMLFYNAFLVLILASYNYTYRKLQPPSMNFCNKVEVVSFSESGLHELDKANPPNGSHAPSMVERCHKYNWNIIAAGGFSSTVAAMLATVHVAALVCKLVEMCSPWVRRGVERGTRNRLGKYHGQGHETVTPRDVEIHGRGTAISDRTGRLTALSAEEYDTGAGVASRRRGAKRSKTSSRKSRSEEILLSCLVP
ncbi:hypothetical protein ACEQ8H_004976 [Pleosporales sp. CAS-2024a]